MVDAGGQAPVSAGPGLAVDRPLQSGCGGHWHHPGERALTRGHGQRLDVNSLLDQMPGEIGRNTPLSA